MDQIMLILFFNINKWNDPVCPKTQVLQLITIHWNSLITDFTENNWWVVSEPTKMLLNTS